MWMLKLKNSSFNRFGSEFATLIDKNHFLGHSSLHQTWYKNEEISGNDVTKDHIYHFTVPIEGFSKEEIHLELSGIFLKITGIKADSPEIENNFISIVKKTICFEQIFELKEVVCQDEITAVYQNEAIVLTFTSNQKNKEREGVEKINIF